MKRTLCLFLLLSLCFSCISCKDNTQAQKPDTSSSQESCLDKNTSEFLKYVKANGFDQSVYFEATVTIGDIKNTYVGAKKGNLMYIEYFAPDHSEYRLFDGEKAYYLNPDGKFAIEIEQIQPELSALLLSFSENEDAVFLETGNELINGIEYTYETFKTSNEYAKLFLDEKGQLKYLHSWKTGTSDNTVSKVEFFIINNSPDEKLFIFPQDYEIRQG